MTIAKNKRARNEILEKVREIYQEGFHESCEIMELASEEAYEIWNNARNECFDLIAHYQERCKDIPKDTKEFKQYVENIRVAKQELINAEDEDISLWVFDPSMSGMNHGLG